MLGPLGLVLASAVLHASWNAIVKREREPPLAVPVVSAIGATVGALAALSGTGFHFPSRRALAFTLLAGVFEGGYFVTLGRALARAPLSVVYTLSRGGALFLVWPTSVACFAERPTFVALAGAFVVVLGLAFTAAPTGQEPSTTRSGVSWALATAGCITGYHLSYKIALSAGAPAAATLALSMGLSVVVNLAVLGEARARVRVRPSLVLAGVLTGVSFLAFLLALSRGGAGAMLTLRNTSVVFALGLSFLLGERPPKAHWLGAILVTLGAIALGWS